MIDHAGGENLFVLKKFYMWHQILPMANFDGVGEIFDFLHQVFDVHSVSICFGQIGQFNIRSMSIQFDIFS